MRRQNLVPITLYVSAEDHELLKAEAESHGVSVSYFCRELIRQYSPVKLTAKQRQGAPQGNLNRRGGIPLVLPSDRQGVTVPRRADKTDTPPVHPVTGQSSALDASRSVVTQEVGSKGEVSSELRQNSRRRRQRA